MHDMPAATGGGNPSRRDVLKHAPAVALAAAGTTVALPAMAAVEPSSAIAALLREYSDLGRRIDAIYRQTARIRDGVPADLRKRLDRGEAPANWSEADLEKYQAYYASTNIDDLEKRVSGLNQRQDLIARRILKAKPRSSADLEIQLRVLGENDNHELVDRWRRGGLAAFFEHMADQLGQLAGKALAA
jgi:hypothetical protein